MTYLGLNPMSNTYNLDSFRQVAWLILCVILTGPCGFHVCIWLNAILGVSVRMFVDMFNIKSIDSKADCSL